ncbi:MAG: ATP-binding protein [Candidatus Parcubacteria bacterium]|nr:ATP-binding protein [Candidatus Parcubacteria bacterium]
MTTITVKGSNLEKVIDKIRTSDRTLFILCGLPYSGKTFFSEKIRKEVDCAYVSIDDIFHSYDYDWNTSTLPDEKAWDEIFLEASEQTKNALARGENVLYDSTNHTRRSRDELRSIAGCFGAQTLVIYMEVSPEIVRSRRLKCIENNDRHVVHEKLVEMTIADFESPTKDENVLCI